MVAKYRIFHQIYLYNWRNFKCACDRFLLGDILYVCMQIKWWSRWKLITNCTNYYMYIRQTSAPTSPGKGSEYVMDSTFSTLRWPLSQCNVSQGNRLHYNYVIMSVIQGAEQRNIKAPRHRPLWGNSPVTGEFPVQMPSNAENVSIWWRHQNSGLPNYYLPILNEWF